MFYKLLVALFIGFLLLSPVVSHAVSFTPFGGKILLVAPCPLNPSASLVTISLGPVKQIVVYQTGVSKSYREGPPIKTGQWLLGARVPLGITCPGTGLIQFHGSSKPGL